MADNVDISDFTMRNSGVEYPWYSGTMLRGSNNVITNNILSNNLHGIYMMGLLGEPQHSTHNTIVDNLVLSNSKNGIWLYRVGNNTVIGNTVSNNGRHGILSHHSANNSIADNFVLNNYFGIGLSDSIGDNIIGNTLSYNEIGIGLQYSSSIIYHNNFINNPQQIYDNSWDFPSIPPSISIWDDGYPSGGNYWSDYVGVDQNGDGIGDAPYVIDENNQDNYPLMEPWSPKPPSPQEALEELIQTVESWNLDTGIETSLTSKLQAAYRSLDRENQEASLGQLKAFTNHVEALRGKKVTTQQADQLTSEAQRIIDLIEG